MTSKFLSDTEFRQLRKDTTKSKMKGVEHLPPNASALDRAKYDLCRDFVLYIRKKGITQRKLAEILGIPESRISEIVHYRIKKLTLDRLVGYYEIIKPNVTLRAV